MQTLTAWATVVLAAVAVLAYLAARGQKQVLFLGVR